MTMKLHKAGKSHSIAKKKVCKKVCKSIGDSHHSKGIESVPKKKKNPPIGEPKGGVCIK